MEQIIADCALVDALLLALEGKLRGHYLSCMQSMRLGETSCKGEAAEVLSTLHLIQGTRIYLSSLEQRIGKISNAEHQD